MIDRPRTLRHHMMASAPAARLNEDIRRSFRGAQSVILGLQKLEIPTVAMVNGDAVGAGFDLAYAYDVVTAVQMAALGSSISLSSEDHREGIIAMREKRSAGLVGR